MTIRQALEQAEHQRLDPRAAFSDRSRGRPVPEPEREDDVRTCYQRDTDRIVHSKAFRRLMHKTQVFLCPEGDHYRTRMTHTLEVARPNHHPGPESERGSNRSHCSGTRPGTHPLRPCR